MDDPHNGATTNNFNAGLFFTSRNKKNMDFQDMSLVPFNHPDSGYSILKSNNLPLILKKGQSVILYKEHVEEINFKDYNSIIKRLYKISGLDDDGIKLIHSFSARKTTENIEFMNDIINMKKFTDVKDDLEKCGVWKDLFDDFYNPNIKKSVFFQKINNTLNMYYELNDIKQKDKIKTINLKESKLTTPKGGDVIDKSDEFPYIKFKVNNFKALVEDIDFKVLPTGEIAPL
jgi:CRISPR-associated endonuclease Csn1